MLFEEVMMSRSSVYVVLAAVGILTAGIYLRDPSSPEGDYSRNGGVENPRFLGSVIGNHSFPINTDSDKFLILVVPEGLENQETSDARIAVAIDRPIVESDFRSIGELRTYSSASFDKVEVGTLIAGSKQGFSLKEHGRYDLVPGLYNVNLKSVGIKVSVYLYSSKPKPPVKLKFGF